MTPPVEPEETPSGLGRDLRLIVGCIMLLANLVLLYMDAHRKPPVPFTVQDLGLHGMLLATALLLVSPKRFLELVGALKDKLPFVGK